MQLYKAKPDLSSQVSPLAHMWDKRQQRLCGPTVLCRQRNSPAKVTTILGSIIVCSSFANLFVSREHQRHYSLDKFQGLSSLCSILTAVLCLLWFYSVSSFKSLAFPLKKSILGCRSSKQFKSGATLSKSYKDQASNILEQRGNVLG